MSDDLQQIEEYSVNCELYPEPYHQVFEDWDFDISVKLFASNRKPIMFDDTDDESNYAHECKLKKKLQNNHN
ncbi:hypothetical protein M5689_003387 [Euphorbia peplus]|nr:hypothetical protein M5689_003387 [Euphorbia peplus]